jgi:hypothetical protein
MISVERVAVKTDVEAITVLRDHTRSVDLASLAQADERTVAVIARGRASHDAPL